MDPLVLEMLHRDVEVWVRNKPLFTLKEASEDLGKPISWLKPRVRSGAIATVNFGKDVRIPRGEIIRIQTRGVE